MMPEGICEGCGKKYGGWALMQETYKTCDICGGKIVLEEREWLLEAINIATSYSTILPAREHITALYEIVVASQMANSELREKLEKDSIDAEAKRLRQQQNAERPTTNRVGGGDYDGLD